MAERERESLRELSRRLREQCEVLTHHYINNKIYNCVTKTPLID
jgi:hypothetical protein